MPVFDEFKRLDIVSHVKEVAPYLEKKLDELVAKYDCLTARRGMGLMQGVGVQPSCRKGLSRGFKSRPYSHHGRQQCAQICASSCYRKE